MAPERVSVNDRSFTSITITWEPVPCVYHNGVITSYVVAYRENGSNEMFRHITTAPEDELNFEITRLKPSTEYEIKVAAFTIKSGPFKSLVASTLGMFIITVTD